MKVNRQHFSWSQYSLWKQSKLSYYKRYCLEEKQQPNKYFDKGKELGKYLESGEHPHWADPLLETVGSLIPKLDIMEDEVRLNPFDGVDETPEWFRPLLVYVDTALTSGAIFYEYKTGKNPWTQQMVDDHEQLDFYAMMYYAKTGIVPECKLIWVETEEVEEQGQMVIKFTGHVEEFHRLFSEDSLSAMMVKIFSIMKEIYEWEYVELELEDNIVDRYIELLEKKKEIDSELNLIKLEVDTRMEAESLEYAVATNGKFSITRRKTWLYSKELLTIKKEYTDEITKKQKLEQKEGKAYFTESQSIRFTAIKN